MDDPDTFFWSMMFGAIGVGYFVYGKNRRDVVLLCLGALLCAFPYFVSSLMLTLVIGAGLTFAPLMMKRA